MAATYLKQKKSLSFGLNYTSKIRPSDPPFRQTLPGTFPWQDKATQTELSLILDVEKTLAILMALQEEMSAAREELKLAKMYLQSEYELLLETKATELTRRINDGLFFLESSYKDRVKGLKYAFKQQTYDYMAKELALKSRDGLDIMLDDEDSPVASLDIEQLRRLERELREKLKNRDELINVLQTKLRQYTQQQEQLFSLQQQNQVQIMQLRGKLRKCEEISFFAPPPNEEDEDVERAYNYAKLGAMYTLKEKHKAEINAIKAEVERYKSQSQEVSKTLEMKDVQLTTFEFEMDRMKALKDDLLTQIQGLQLQLVESQKAVETERTEASRMIGEMKNKLAQEAERQERRRKWQMFMQDPTKILSLTKQPSHVAPPVPQTPEKMREEVLRIAFESDFAIDTWGQILDYLKKLENNQPSSSHTIDGGSDSKSMVA